MARIDTNVMILSVAETLFLERGIKSVSIEELCREVGISRKTFYSYYKNKVELLIGLLDWMMDPMQDQFVAIMEEELPFEDQMLKFAKIKLDYSRRMNIQFVTDLYLFSDSRVLDYLNRKLQTISEQYKFFLHRAQQKGDIRKDLQIDFLMLMLSLPGELVRDRRLESLFSDSTTLIQQCISFYLYGILGHNSSRNQLNEE